MTGGGRPAGSAAGAALLALAVLALSTVGVTVAAVSAATGPLPAGCGPAGTAQRLAEVTLDAEQLANAQLIAATTARTRMPAAAAVIAVMAAHTESGLRNLPGGDRDSAGLFQIRTGLHGRDVATDPKSSTRWFLARLASLPNWQQLAPTQAAAAVERPAAAYRTRYTGAQDLATAVVARLWPTATATAADPSRPATGGPGNTGAGQASAGPDSDVGLPLCPAGGPGSVGAAGAATAGVPCTAGTTAGTVVAGPGGVPIRICTVGPWQVDTTIASRITALLAASRAAGLDLGGGSYRPTTAQVALRRAHCGPTDYDLYQRPAGQCSPPTARPGRSMHEWARALDITDHGRLLRSHTDPAFQWLAAHAATYGLANLPSEPWHWSTSGK